MLQTIHIFSPAEVESPDGLRVLQLSNDADPLAVSLEGIDRVELNFPKFTDGRAFTQAWLIRRRRKFAGDIRATGDVLVDELVQMQRTGFSSAVLRADRDAADAKRQFDRYPAYYQGDAGEPRPLFARAG
jgi:uncharacterized protein (DUF934 family)